MSINAMFLCRQEEEIEKPPTGLQCIARSSKTYTAFKLHHYSHIVQRYRTNKKDLYIPQPGTKEKH